ncbi:MAG TPA: histidine--tRNA ligase, partial [Thermoleophilia bacterium]|nr:histidine--tRNA ligase [Thermoleophilia bacterium]
PQAPKGTYDLLPDDAERRADIVAIAADVFTSYGYRQLVTPEFEETGLFARGVGEATDIVRKEMYSFADRSGRDMTLRPEGTAPVCRAYVEHGMFKLAKPVKLWYYAPMFRYEKPQAGRYREHWQLGAEALGSDEPAVDAEIIAMLGQLYDELEIDDLTLAINSMGDQQCRPAYVELLRGWLAEHQDELCGECRERMVLNPLRVFDCKVETCRSALNEAPHIVDHLCDDCRRHFETVLDLVRRVGLDPVIDFRLVRGLDYYTRTTFEYQSTALGFAQSTVGGGGRYDGLVEQIGGPPTPGVGFGSGLERVTLVAGLEAEPDEGPLAYVVAFDAESRGDAFVLTQHLRRDLVIDAECDLAGRSPKSQLKQAARSGAEVAVLVGLDDLADGQVRLRDLETGDEEDVDIDHLGDWFEEWLEGGDEGHHHGNGNPMGGNGDGAR